MKNKSAIGLLILAVLGLCSGCASRLYQNILRVTPDKARWETLRVSADRAFQAAMETCIDLGFEVVATDEENHTARFWVSGQKRSQVFWNLNAAVFVREIDISSCRVGVVTLDQRGHPIDEGWPSGIFAGLKSYLDCSTQPTSITNRSNNCGARERIAPNGLLKAQERTKMDPYNDMLDRIAKMELSTSFLAKFTSQSDAVDALGKLPFATVDGDGIALPKNILCGIFPLDEGGVLVVLGGSLSSTERIAAFETLKAHGTIKSIAVPPGTTLP